MRFFNDSLRLNLEQFFPNDSLVYDVFGLFRCTRSNSLNIYVFHGKGNKKVVAHSSGLQKLLKLVSEYTKIDIDTNEYLDIYVLQSQAKHTN